MSRTGGTITAGQLVDGGERVEPFQMSVFVLCLLCLVMDGFDVQVIGFVAPAIIADWGIDKAQLTPVFTAGLLGMLVGSLAFSWLADRIGRRPILIGATLFFALCMLVTASVNSLGALVAIRFVTGLGLGAIMPNAMALSGEFSPQRIRVTVMMIVACGFTIGAAVGGLIAVALVEWVGWRGVFVAGGIMPLILALVMMLRLPESLHFRVARGEDPSRLAPVIARLRPDLADPAALSLVPETAQPGGGALRDLFTGPRRTGTFLLWGMNFMNLLVLYFLSSWVPTLLVSAGHPQQVAILAGTLIQVGGIAGTLSLGRAIDLRGFGAVMVPLFALAGAALLAIGQPLPDWLLYITVTVIGFCIVGGQPALNSLAASYYPASIRATGIGWSLGIGRFGSVLGPIVGGALMLRAWPSETILMTLALPAFLTAALMLVMTGTLRRNPPH